jgi:DNA-binding MarR family transcriptional regulator
MKTRDVRKFRRVLRQFTRLINSQLKTCCSEVTLAQCLVLLEIDSFRTPTMGQLAANLRLDNSTLSRTADGLVARGLVERVNDDSDRRVVKLRLTQEGEAVCRRIHADNDASCRRVFGKIPASDQGRVAAAFETLVEAYLACEDDETCK